MITTTSKLASPSQFFIYADLQLTEDGVNAWRFIVESLDGSTSTEASDTEPGTDGERLELLSVLRALESLDQPSEVYLLTPSQYVIRGIRFGLEAWRESSWRWERFGRMVPVKNADLWERIDRALTYHQVRCRRASIQLEGRPNDVIEGDNGMPLEAESGLDRVAC